MSDRGNARAAKDDVFVSGQAAVTPARRGERRRRSGPEELMVPPADFRSYYGRQILKSPTWERLDIGGYLFTGGLAAGSGVVAALGDLTGRASLRRAGRFTAMGAVVVSLVGLVHDLGRPERFLNMLRVFKPTSPMSVGTYILSVFSGLMSIAVAGEVTGRAPRIARVAGLGGAAVAPALATYTAVLFADTAVPAWHETYRELPFVFAGSALSAAGSAAVLLGATDDIGPARRMIAVGGASELVAAEVMERNLGIVGENYEQGPAGRIMTIAKACTATAVGLAVIGEKVPSVGRVAGLFGLAGSLLTRFGVFEAGRQSTEDPRYVVVPQRERLDRAGAASPDVRA